MTSCILKILKSCVVICSVDALRLVLPTVRASIENACARVARGEAQKARVVELLGRPFKVESFLVSIEFEG